MNKLASVLATFSILVGLADATPNPSAVYCCEQGYEYEIRTLPDGGQYGVCIFPDGSECHGWQYYCKCEPDGIGCWPGDFNCDFPCEELACKEAGEFVLISKCCEGLTKIPRIEAYDDECNLIGFPGWTYICSDCGNGICETWESKCNCPEDCNCLDTDGDRACDWVDNCPHIYNPRQTDSDADGIGNLCDADCPYLDGVNPVNGIDFSLLAYNWQQSGPELQGDVNADRLVDIEDLAILAAYWLSDCR